jgi:epoxyqueuosine reductase
MAVARARYHGMRRNALYAIGSARDGAARGVVERLVDDGDASVRDAAAWALQRLGQDRS